MHMYEKRYIYGATDIIHCGRMAASFYCVWMKNAAHDPLLLLSEDN